MRSTQGRVLRIVLVILMIFLVLGLLLQYVTKQYMIKDSVHRLERNGKVLADLAAAYYADGTMTNMQFLINMDLASEFSECDILLCNETGHVLLCSDSPTGCYHQRY